MTMEDVYRTFAEEIVEPVFNPNETARLTAAAPEQADSHTGSNTVSSTPGGLTSVSNASNASNGMYGGPDLLAGLRDGTWLAGQTFPPLRYAVNGLIPEGASLLVGPPKAGKSWLTLNVLLAVASESGLALGKIHTGGARRVLYLALEDGDRRMQERCGVLLGGGEIPALFTYMTKIHPGALVATLTAFLETYPDTALIVIDTLGKVMPRALQGESPYERDYRVGGLLKAVADEHPGLALVVIHHDRKAVAEDFVHAVSGTNGLSGAFDTTLVLSRQRFAREAVLSVTGRDVEENAYGLVLHGGTAWDLDGLDLAEAASRAGQRAETQRLSDVSVEILDFIREHEDGKVGGSGLGVRAADITAEFGPGAATYLKRRVEGGTLIKTSRGRYAIPGGTV